MKLNIGSGAETREGFINVDIQPLPGVEMVAEAWSLPLIDNGQVSEIYCRHALEHLTLKEARLALREWVRVLRDGGEAHIICPNRDFHISIMKTDPKLAMGGLYGWQNDEHDVHKWAWTANELTHEMVKAGFCWAIEQETREQDIHIKGRIRFEDARPESQILVK